MADPGVPPLPDSAYWQQLVPGLATFCPESLSSLQPPAAIPNWPRFPPFPPCMPNAVDALDPD